MHIQEDPRTIISWLQRHNSFQLFCLTKITDFLQNPVLQLLQKNTQNSNSHSSWHYLWLMQYFVLCLTFPSFLTGELGGEKKGERWSNWPILSRHRSRAWWALRFFTVIKIPVSCSYKDFKKTRQRHNRNLFSWQQFNNKRKCSEPLSLLLGNFNLVDLVPVHGKLQIPFTSYRKGIFVV